MERNFADEEFGNTECIGSITEFVRFANRWRNLIIIPSFQYSEHALESYCHCASFSVYVIHLKRKQQ